jgi:hypothetical protein
MPDVTTTKSTAYASLQAAIEFAGLDTKLQDDNHDDLTVYLGQLSNQFQDITYGQIGRYIYAGNPVICEMKTFDEFDGDYEDGILGLPALPAAYSVHTTCLTGYDDGEHMFYARHNRGPSFGLTGYFMLSYDYVKQYGLRFFVITKVPVEVSTVIVPTIPIVNTPRPVETPRPSEAQPLATPLDNTKLLQVCSCEYRQPEMAKIKSMLMIMFKNSTVGHYDTAMVHINSYMKALFDRIYSVLDKK